MITQQPFFNQQITWKEAAMAFLQLFSKSFKEKRILEKSKRSKQQRPLVLEHLEIRNLQAADLCTAFDGYSVASVCKPSVAANISTLHTSTNESLTASRSVSTQYGFGQAPANQGTQHRGFMIEPADFFNESSRIRALDELAGWKVNLVRWQINVKNNSDIGSSMLNTVQKIKEVASGFQEKGIQIILDFHPTKDGNIYSSLNRSESARRNLVNTWREVAKQLKDVPAVAGYDVLNEPQGLSIKQWNSLAESLVDAIRKEARRDQPVVIESLRGDPNLLDSLPRFPREKNVVYSFHMYSTERYTHQGIDGRSSGVMMDGSVEKAMVRDMNTVKNFQNTFRSQDRPRIFVGEFSVVRRSVSNRDLNGNGQLDDITDTDGTNKYLRTCMDYFQREGWDWTYHAYDEAPQWDLKLGDSADLELVKSRLDPTYIAFPVEGHIRIKTVSGLYFAAEGGGGREVVANRVSPGGWETFQVVALGRGKVALRAFNGNFLCAEGGGGGAVVANRSQAQAWETFEVTSLGGRKFALRTSQGHYLCALNGGGGAVVADRLRIGSWETFEWEIV